jgi:hypothetical protein
MLALMKNSKIGLRLSKKRNRKLLFLSIGGPSTLMSPLRETKSQSVTFAKSKQMISFRVLSEIMRKELNSIYTQNVCFSTNMALL